MIIGQIVCREKSVVIDLLNKFNYDTSYKFDRGPVMLLIVQKWSYLKLIRQHSVHSYLLHEIFNIANKDQDMTFLVSSPKLGPNFSCLDHKTTLAQIIGYLDQTCSSYSSTCLHVHLL